MRNVCMPLCCLLLMLCLFISSDGLCQESGAQSAHRLISESGTADNIPQSSVDSFCTGIAKIESASSVRIAYSQMSPWRKRMFQNSVTEWITQYPSEECYQTETILKGHESQNLGYIAQLYVVPPLEIDAAISNEAITQLKEIETILKEGSSKKMRAVSDALRKKYPALGETFSLKAVDGIFLLNYAQPLDDDLNYKLRYPLTAKSFDDLKKRISAIIEKTMIDSPFIAEHDLVELSQLKKEGKIESANERIRPLTEKLGRDVQFKFSTTIQRLCDEQIYKAYGDVLPPKILTDYRRFGYDIERLVDTSIVRKAFDEHGKIAREQMKKRHDERKAEWDMIVVAQPKDTPIPAYELPKSDHGRFQRFMVMNGIIITIFAIYLFLRWRHVRKHGKHS